MTKKLDELRWKADEFGELLNDLRQEVLNEVGPLTDVPKEQERQMWLQTLNQRFDSLYWTLEHLTKVMMNWEQENVLSAASSVESVEDIVPHLIQPVPVRIAPGWLRKNSDVPLVSPSPPTHTTSSLPEPPSPSPNLNQGTSYSTTPEPVDPATVIPTWESSSETGYGWMP
jgi:hypothetical protein